MFLTLSGYYFRSINQSIKQSSKQSIKQASNQANSQSSKHVIKQSSIQSINQSNLFPCLIPQFKYKRRVYKQMKLDLQQVKKYHSKANLKAFMEAVRNRQAEKVTKMLEKCLDPNFHEESSGGNGLSWYT